MRTRAALLLILPAALLFVYSFAVPLVMVVRLSLFTVKDGIEVFVGFSNYLRAFQDSLFWLSYANVFWFVLLIAPLGIGIPYSIALFLQRFTRPVQSAGRFICYVPSLASGLVIALLWKWLLARGGLINEMLTYIGLPVVAWIGSPIPAKIAIAMISLSGGGGMFVILFTAVIYSIPKELREAAIVDGATDRQYRRLVLRPLLMPTVLLALLLTIVGVMQMWSEIYVIFPTGGPYGSCLTPVYDIFMTAFIYSRPNYGAAKGVILLIAIAAVVAIQRKIEALAGAYR